MQIDVDFYDFDYSVPKNIDKNDTSGAELKVEANRESNLFNHTKILYNRRYGGTISSRDDSLDAKKKRRISVKESDMNKTFRITKNTFEIRNAYGSIDAKSRRQTQARNSSTEDESLRNALNRITLKRGPKNVHNLF
jgi:hypothetical protein